MKDLFPMDWFVDRDAEINELRDRLSFSRDDEIELRKRIVHVIGKSGIGKTSLIKKFYNQLLLQEDLLPIYIDLTKYSKLNEDAFIKDLLKFIGGEIADELGVIFTFQDVGQLSELSNWITSVWRIQKQKTLVLLFDEISLLSRDQVSILENYLLDEILLFSRIFLVFVGRYPISGFKDFDLRPSVGDVIEPSRFDYENTKKQLEASKKTQDMKFAARMQMITGGSPGNNRKIIDKITGDLPQFDELDAIRTCNEELYAALKVAGQRLLPNLAVELLPALEALCVLQDFDKEYEVPILLAAHTGLSGEWDLKRSSALLNNLCDIYIGPGLLVDWNGEDAYVIEEQVRFNLEQELKIGNPVLWKKLHCTAMKMYADWAKEYNSNIFETKSEYHRTALRDAGFDPETCQEG